MALQTAGRVKAVEFHDWTLGQRLVMKTPGPARAGFRAVHLSNL